MTWLGIWKEAGQPNDYVIIGHVRRAGAAQVIDLEVMVKS